MSSHHEWPHATYVHRMSDDELERAIAVALAEAHAPDDVPFNECNLHHDGTREIRNPCRAWAKASNEWVKLCEERDRRARR